MKRSAYSRPAKPLFAPVPVRNWRERTITEAGAPIAPVIVDAGTECHVTPPDVARRMVWALGDVRGRDALEPSAGTGNLARALIDAGADRSRLTLVEMHTRLAAGLNGLGRVVCADFLEWAQSAPKFSAIVLNPPFSRVRAHMAAAAGLLAPGGVLVALVPVTYTRDDMDTLETLGPDTFASAKVHTKLIMVR